MPIQVAIFDFDLTLSVEHVFQLLAGGLPPAATTQAGQLARIRELESSPEFQAHGGFAVSMLGGYFRISQLNDMLSTLRKSGVECLVLTKGMVGPVKKMLDQTQLLKYFSGVYGNTGEYYGVTDYDRTANPGPDSRFISGQECQTPENKQQFIQQYMYQKGLGYQDVVFIDDTLEEIRSCFGICQTVSVMTKGMNQEIMAQVLQMAPVAPESDVSSAARILSPAVASNLASSPPVVEKINSQPPPFIQRAPAMEVFSRQSNCWCPAVITGSDEDGRILLQYTSPDGQVFVKALPRGHKDVRKMRPKHGDGVEEVGDVSDAESQGSGTMCQIGDTRCPKKPRIKRGRKGPCCTQ